MRSGFHKAQVVEIFNKSGGHCWYCGSILTLESRYTDVNPGTFAIDHVEPKARGGSDAKDNLVPSCWACNSRKRSYNLEEFRELETRLENRVPRFSDEQIFYLQSIGAVLPHYEPHVFWFEREKL